ncbi:alpha/beta hydrolase [Streptomyces mirabilis]|uniref:alpha/beta hydrolase n=1 Tax=Streptomyces mirabilis TaxID=68239 RepID=UPI0033336443
MSTKPAIVMVHGFWGGAAHWGKAITELHARGYNDLHAVELTFSSLADDADRVRRQVARIDGPVLLMGHSYGGAVITEAGDVPNVVGLVYIAAFAPDSGESPGQIAGGFAPAAGFGNIAPDAEGNLWIAQDKYHESFAQDLPEDEAYVMAVTQKAPPASTFGDAVKQAAWHSVPSWYQVSTDDRMINPDAQRHMASRMGTRRTIELNTGHASLASRPGDIADLIDTAVAELDLR